EERPADFGSIAGDARDAAHGQAMVAAEENRERAAPEGTVRGRLDRAGPAGDLAGIARRTGELDRRVDRRRHVAAVGHPEGQRAEGRLDSGDPECGRTHDAAAPPCSGFDRHTDELDCPLRHVRTARNFADLTAEYAVIPWWQIA